DTDGKFVLEGVDEQATLVFSYTGYQKMEVQVAGKSKINVVLLEDTQNIDEVVVVAFGKQKKQDLVGAVSTINPANLKIPASNLTAALAGQISGMIAYQRSGEPGADNADFFIRGVTTFGY